MSGTVGKHAVLAADFLLENVAQIPVGNLFALSSRLSTSATVEWGVASGEPDEISAGASSNFFNTSSFTLSSSTPGGTLHRVPEPPSLPMFLLGLLVISAFPWKRFHRLFAPPGC